jgi:dodecin
MSIAKVVEITSDSTVSFNDAIEAGIRRAEKSLKQVRGAWISEQKILVDKGVISGYRVTMRVTFVLK